MTHDSQGEDVGDLDQPVVARPRRVVIFGAFAAAFVLATMIAVGLALRSSTAQVVFRSFDQIGLISVGVFGAGLIMLVARPRVRADERGIAVRNILGETFFPWADVVRIAFPPGAHWARVILPDEENIPILAVQAMDKQYAVDSLRRIRALHERYRPPADEVNEQQRAQDERRARAEAAAAAARPLGRLELIDRQKAAEGAAERRAARERGSRLSS